MLIPVTALVILLLALLWVFPVPHPFSAGDCGAYFAPCRISVPPGSLVSASWSTTEKCRVYLWVQEDHGARIYSSYDTSGSLEFVATDPPYYVYDGGWGCVGWVHVDGTYYSPLL